jgi:hypothetical protein
MHWLPQWLLDLGSIGGLVTVVFLIVDRFLKGRPSISIEVEPHGHRYLTISTQPGVGVGISAFRSRADVYRVSKDGEISSLLRAQIANVFVATIPGGTTAKFFLIALPDGKPRERPLANRYRWTPIWLSWRKASSLWLPQIPVFSVIDNVWLRNQRNEGHADP